MLVSTSAHAYVDPGTGGMAIQFLVGGILAAIFMVKTYYYELKRKIANLFGRNSAKDSADTLSEAQPSTAAKPSIGTE